MHVTWVTRSFLDYRIPIYDSVNTLCGNKLVLIYNGEVVPPHLTVRMRQLLGDRCVPLSGELRLVGKALNPVSNTLGGGKRIPIQKGLYKEIKNSCPEIVLSDGFFQWTLMCIIYKMFHPKVKHIMCYEGWKHTERNAGWVNTLYRKIAGHFIDAICCNGILSKEYVKGLGYPENQIVLGNMSADILFFREESSHITEEEKKSFRRQFNLNDIIYVFSGRLVQLKGIAELLVIWKTFTVGKEDRVSLLLVGDGPQRTDLEQYCKDNSLTNVVFAGKVDYARLPLYYAASSAFVIPTLQDNWSLVVPEAMACGLPILCSVYNGCWPELVHSENGWTFNPLDYQNMKDVLNDSYQKAHHFREMGDNSQKIVDNYRPETIASIIFSACNNHTEQRS